MCRAKFLLLLSFTVFGCQAYNTLSDDDNYLLFKKHLSSLARDGLIPGKRYVASLIKNVKPIYYPPGNKKFAHPFHVFQKPDLLDEDKRYIGTVLAKSGHSRSFDKRNLMDGMVFGEDMRRYLQSANSDKRSDSNFSDDMEVLLGDDRDKKNYGVDALVFGEDLRKALREETDNINSNNNNQKRKSLPYPLLNTGKRMYAGVDGLVFGEDMRRYLQSLPDEVNKRGFNNLMDQMVSGEDLSNNDILSEHDDSKRGYSLMDGMVFGEDLRNKVLKNYNEKRGHGLMDGMVFAEDLRKAIQEATVKKEKQKLKEEKELTNQKNYPSKTLSKANGKRSVQALARNGYTVKNSDQGKRAGLEALARNGLLKTNGKQGKRAGLEALARNGYLNKCNNNGNNGNKRSLSILAKNGLIPQNLKSNKREPEDEDTLTQNYYDTRPRPYLSYFVKRPFLGHRPSASATTRNIPFFEPNVISPDKKNFASEESEDPYELELQKRYVATLLKEASSPAKINIRGVAKSIEEGSEDDGTEEKTEESESKRSFADEESSLSDEFSMPVMQNSASRNLEEAIDELVQLSHDNTKRYYAVKGGGRILGGRLQELGKHKQNQSRQKSWL